MGVAAVLALAGGALDLFMKIMTIANQIKGTEKIPTPEEMMAEWRAMQAKIDAEKGKSK
jgi:hypothetical protein